MKKWIILIFSIHFLLTGCKTNRRIATPEHFSNVMRKNEYIVKNMIRKYQNNLSIEAAVIAMKEDLRIEYYKTDNENRAAAMFDINKEKCRRNRENKVSEENENSEDYSKYVLKTNFRYKVVARLKNTLIYVDVPLSEETKIREVLEEIKY
ncbi:hypothetical protein [Sebaldella sp. S0638]|uniref:hypothetical protein n=1 Tax=Sebaldella sp. S0638 TaxID=2957809 RepID=UPI00209CF9D2|nr:hypothetical protein [Sebaldella sp. S0638]MCP1226115.1 hypothetical protein [Sebaldella sp. S0638]